MRKLAPFLLLLAACTDSTGSKQPGNDSTAADTAPAASAGAMDAAAANAADAECVFEFSAAPTCSYAEGPLSIEVTLVTTKIADNEIELPQANVVIEGKQHELKLSADTSMTEGSRGSVLFDDISFDGTPDLAVATSFGTANQYLDYWIYDPAAKEYASVGNFPRLVPDPATKTLTADVRMNAASRETHVYAVVGNKLELKKQ
jgi:hypothetical protein